METEQQVLDKVADQLQLKSENIHCHVMGKLAFCIRENKSSDHIRYFKLLAIFVAVLSVFCYVPDLIMHSTDRLD